MKKPLVYVDQEVLTQRGTDAATIQSQLENRLGLKVRLYVFMRTSEESDALSSLPVLNELDAPTLVMSLDFRFLQSALNYAFIFLANKEGKLAYQKTPFDFQEFKEFIHLTLPSAGKPKTSQTTSLPVALSQPSAALTPPPPLTRQATEYGLFATELRPAKKEPNSTHCCRMM